MSHGKEIDEKSFYNLITEFEYQWTLQTNVYSESSGEDPIRIANLLYIKYNPYFDKWNGSNISNNFFINVIIWEHVSTIEKGKSLMI